MRLRNVLIFCMLLICALTSSSFGAYTFDGVNDEVLMDDNAAETLPEADWAVSCFVKQNTLTGWVSDGNVVSHGGAEEATFKIDQDIGVPGAIEFSYSDDGVNFSTISTDPPNQPMDGITDWVNIIWQRVGTNLEIYVNGTNYLTTDITAQAEANATNQLAFGAADNNTNPLPGSIAECAKWDRSFTLGEITGLANFLSPRA